MSSIPVVILAGKPPERDELLEFANKDNKVLIEYKGRTLLEIAIDAVLNAEIATKIVLVGINATEVPVDIEQIGIPVECLEMEGEQFDKIYQGAKYIVETHEEGEVDHILYMSADMPHLHEDVIQTYLDQVQDRPEADFYYSIVAKEDALTGLPEFDWGYMKVKDGHFVSGNLIYIRPNKLMDKYDLIKFVSKNRKSFIWGVLKASPWLFLKLIFGRIKLSEAEKLMTSFFELESVLIVSPNYELAFDLDRAEDLKFLQRME